MNWLISALIGALLIALGWLVWVDGRRQPGEYLFNMTTAQAEAGFCLGAAERAQSVVYAQRVQRGPDLVSEQIGFWRSRAGPDGAKGRQAMATARDAAGEEKAFLSDVLRACANRAVGLYGHRFASLE